MESHEPYLEVFDLNRKIDNIEYKGLISDGSHTFDELYYHRAVLFAECVRHHKDVAWKSRKHSDGTMFDGYFIAGVTTPKGDYTYHVKNEEWWMFECKELDLAPEWDGHKPSDILRILSLHDD